MDAAAVLRDARARAGMTQRALARSAGTSQATLSAYETGRKVPTLQTLGRLLRATGARLVVEHGLRPARTPSPDELREAGRELAEVLALAEALPTHHRPGLRFPRLPGSGGAAGA
jgi:hypothetical protein